MPSVCASPRHLVACGHAVIYGAAQATRFVQSPAFYSSVFLPSLILIPCSIHDDFCWPLLLLSLSVPLPILPIFV